MKIIYSLLFVLLCGCSTTSTWTDANQQERNQGFFIPDDNYYNSDQYKSDIAESAQTIINLQQELGKSAY